MDVLTHAYFVNLDSDDWDLQYEAYQKILEITKREVTWAYEVWDELVEHLRHKDPHIRSRAAQFLAHLAISDPEERILDDFPKLWRVATKDPKFVTKRHSLQSIWRVGLAGKKQKDLLLDHLIDWFKNCENEKNCTLIRSDIIQGLRNLHSEAPSSRLEHIAYDLIELETDEKYKAKYEKTWKVHKQKLSK